ncbi:hypothetical protein [Acetobacter malorum]|uniref:hypothetical protein n=1 Tax=Acetobacter malorum TaxID=178901 RepID=UPI000AED0B18|nr:hypothetical protein [Acetobacter malorum]
MYSANAEKTNVAERLEDTFNELRKFLPINASQNVSILQMWRQMFDSDNSRGDFYLFDRIRDVASDIELLKSQIRSGSRFNESRRQSSIQLLNNCEVFTSISKLN